MGFELILTGEQAIPAELLDTTPRPVNHAKLDADLKAALGSLIAGTTRRNSLVAVLLTGIPNETQRGQIETLFAAHNPAVLTPDQQAEVDRQQTEVAAKTHVPAALVAYSSAITDLTDNWATLAAGAKLEAVRAGVLVALRLVRWLVAREIA